MEPNHEYVLDFIRENSSEDTKSLDYGCGAAEIVFSGREEGLNVYGTELFYEGGNTKEDVVKLGYLGSIVKEIENDRIDFPNEYFDIVVNNQVLEHVENLDIVLKEIHRVLKHGGKLLSIFPSREVWSEGHCGIPFLHRFPKHSKLRVYYAFVWRLFGKGYFGGSKTKMQWSKDFCDWLDKFTFYRPQKEIVGIFGRYFKELEFIETDYLLFRIRRISPKLAKIFSCILRIPPMNKLLTVFVHKKGGLVFVATKPHFAP